MIDLLETEPFRVYSDRQIETRQFAWSPHMDLLATLSSDAGNPHVSVWRLIEDKQSNSALLFSEKIPFQGTAVAWVPDKRSLTVGDVNGNVFVYDAECQRSIELQKVQDCAISSIEWVQGSRVDDDLTSRFSKLPKLSLPFSTIAGLVGDPNQPTDDIPAILECDSLACGDNLTVMGVLGAKGKVSLYQGGSVPIAEFQSASISCQESHLHISPDLASICISSQSDSNSSSLFLLNSSILKLRSREIGRLGSRLSRAHWILKSINTSIDIIQRATASSMDDFQSFFDLIDIEDFSSTEPPLWVQSHSLGKFLKLARSSLNLFDYMSVNLCSCLHYWIDHLTMTVTDISDMSNLSSKFGLLGLSHAMVEPLVEYVKEVRNQFNESIDEFQQQSRVFKWFFFCVQNWLQTIAKSGPDSSSDTTDPLLANLKLSPCDKPVHDFPTLSQLNPRASFDVFSGRILDKCKLIEESFLSIQSVIRRSLGSQIFAANEFVFPGAQNIGCVWRSPDRLDVTYTHSGDLVFSTFVGNRGIFSQVSVCRFKAPESLLWRLPQFYRSDKICALLEHGQGVSIALLSIENCQLGESILTPDQYGVAGMLMAQQLPETLMFTCVEVSSNRGLCSIYSTCGRLITLDLDPDPNDDDDEDNEEQDQEDASMRQASENVSGSSSGGSRRRIRRSKSWFDENKFFNADGMANVRRKIKEERSDSDNSVF